MKILLAHDYYRSDAPSGEDAVFRNERALLEANGVEVIPFERFNDDIDERTFAQRVRLALNGAWSRQTYSELSTIIRSTRPDVGHFHNTFPLISPSAYAACQDNGVPVVQTLHNFRFICPGALLLRAGKPCQDCVGSTLFPALRNRCYRSSLSATGAQVWTIASNRMRGTYRKLVNRYIALTRFAADRMAAGGLPADLIEVKPNFLPDPPIAAAGGGDYGVYVGRISEEKGVKTLLAAWSSVVGVPLKVLGDGPLRAELELQAGGLGLDVQFMGTRPKDEVLSMVGKSLFQVVPSEWYEGFPMVILEAYACARPVVASCIGGLAEVIQNGETGLHFEAGNPIDLALKINELVAAPNLALRLGMRAREVFMEKYTPQKNFKMLSGIYQRARENLEMRRRA